MTSSEYEFHVIVPWARGGVRKRGKRSTKVSSKLCGWHPLVWCQVRRKGAVHQSLTGSSGCLSPQSAVDCRFSV